MAVAFRNQFPGEIFDKILEHAVSAGTSLRGPTTASSHGVVDAIFPTTSTDDQEYWCLVCCTSPSSGLTCPHKLRLREEFVFALGYRRHWRMRLIWDVLGLTGQYIFFSVPQMHHFLSFPRLHASPDLPHPLDCVEEITFGAPAPLDAAVEMADVARLLGDKALKLAGISWKVRLERRAGVPGFSREELFVDYWTVLEYLITITDVRDPLEKPLEVALQIQFSASFKSQSKSNTLRKRAGVSRMP